MAARRRRRDGPRQATRFIGDALVLEGDLTKGAPAVWRAGKERRCAVVRVETVSRDWEYGVDELPLQIAAAAAEGPGLVKRLATYTHEDSEDIVIVEDDVADVTVRDLINAVSAEPGSVPPALALYVARAMSGAASSVEVGLWLHPEKIGVAWDGHVWLRTRAVPPHDDWSDDALGDAAYTDGPAAALQAGIVGAVAYELLTGRHPFLPAANDDGGDSDADDDDDDDDDDDADDDDADQDDDEVAEELRRRRLSGTHQPLVGLPADVAIVVERLLAHSYGTWDAVNAALDDALAAEPFGAQELAGMMRGWFRAKREQCLVEREDRLSVMPGAKVELEDWKPLADTARDDEDGTWSMDLDDVRKGRDPDFHDGVPYEPSVPPVDPFEDEP